MRGFGEPRNECCLKGELRDGLGVKRCARKMGIGNAALLVIILRLSERTATQRKSECSGGTISGATTLFISSSSAMYG